MASPVIADTGPLVALLDQRDPAHAWVDAQLDSLPAPLLTCEAVISECAFLLRSVDPGARSLFELLRNDFLRLGFQLDHHQEAVARLMAKYADVPMSLADACLVRMSELHDGARVFTVDSDFKVYRRLSRQTIPLIYPAA
jgi:predicted nucleic acid-binding protein